METAKLVFHKTLSIADFKALNNNNSIEVIKNPNTSKLFFTCGAIIGATSADYKENPCVSLVSGSDSVDFWMLHKKATTNTVDTL
jgi:hypothetical protein